MDWPNLCPYPLFFSLSSALPSLCIINELFRSIATSSGSFTNACTCIPLQMTVEHHVTGGCGYEGSLMKCHTLWYNLTHSGLEKILV